jgi:predicted Zn-dependent protease
MAAAEPASAVPRLVHAEVPPLIAIAFKLIALIGFAIMFVWTLLTGREAVPLTDRTQIIAVSNEEAAALGAQAFREVLSQHQAISSGPAADRVRVIAERIAEAAEASIDVDYQWEVALLKSDDANAFALPGGKVAVLTGLLDVARTDDQLATVIGHEVAHVLARHGSERLTQEKLAATGRLAVGIAIGDLDPAAQTAILGALGLGAQFGVLMPFSRIHEAEADRIGLIVTARACYDPRAAIEMWGNMARGVGGGPPEFLSTHPSHGSRMEALRGWMDEALAARADAGCPALPPVPAQIGRS